MGLLSAIFSRKSDAADHAGRQDEEGLVANADENRLFSELDKVRASLAAEPAEDADRAYPTAETLGGLADDGLGLDGRAGALEAEPHAAPEEATEPAEPTNAMTVDAPGAGAEGASAEAAAPAKPASVNIWDLDDGGDGDAALVVPAPKPDTEKTIVSAVAQPSPAATRTRRNRTRLIGFEKSDGDVVDLFGQAPQQQVTDRIQFPVAWLLVIEGPGRGHCFPIRAGMSQIGRGEDQTVPLDFGDNAISRNGHAAIVYDPQTRKFMLGHGGKVNIVRLNGAPVISNEDITDGDRISIGETTLQLKTFCGPDFDWSDKGGDEEQEDVAIA